MSYNGSGTFTINTTGQPVVAGTIISASAFNSLTTDLATGLTTAITKDGQTTTTARITFAQGVTSSLTTDSSSISTGSIITGGGVGIAKALFVGTTANVAGAVTLGGIATFSAQPIFSSLTASSAVATDASKGLVSVTNTGTGNNVLGTSPTIATPTITGDATISGLTVGKGGGAVSTNTAVGVSALAANQAGGTNNTAIGNEALDANTTGDANTAIGDSALGANTTFSFNTAVGYQALYSNAVSGNTATGYQSMLATTTGTSNAAFGLWTLKANTTGQFNTAIGDQALQSNTTASYNTAVGYQAGYTATTNISNCFIGAKAGYAATGANNTYVGAYNSGGNGSGSAMTSGNSNTILGGYTGNQGGLDIRTASNYIVLSDGDGNPRAYINQAGFAKFSPTGSVQTQTGSEHEFVCNQQDIVIEFTNQLTSGTPYGQRTRFNGVSPNNTTSYFFNAVDSTTSCYTIWSNGTTSGRSDARLKKNISDATPKLDDICRLQVRNYEWETSNDGSKEIGLIAQEVETVFPNLVVTHDVEKDGDDYKEVKYSVFVPMLLKAIQELKTIVDAQAAEIAELKAKVGI